MVHHVGCYRNGFGYYGKGRVDFADRIRWAQRSEERRVAVYTRAWVRWIRMQLARLQAYMLVEPLRQILPRGPPFMHTFGGWSGLIGSMLLECVMLRGGVTGMSTMTAVNKYGE